MREMKKTKMKKISKHNLCEGNYGVHVPNKVFPEEELDLCDGKWLCGGCEQEKFKEDKV